MGVHPRVNSVIAKRLWNVLRIAFFMIRKGLISKRKLMMDLNLVMKIGGKLLRKSLSNLIHHHHSRHLTRGNFGVQEYEFSCSNSPNPVFFHVSKRKHHYFPCINAPEVVEEEEDYPEEHRAVALIPKTPEYTFNFQFNAPELNPGGTISPLLSPFSVRLSNYSSEDENDAGNLKVDDQAEEFIRRFYENLRAQSRMHLLQYQETPCH